MIQTKMAKEFTEPHWMSWFRMVEMFTRASAKEMKELKSFIDVDSKLKLLIVMTAFSMGIDCPNNIIRNVIHFGVPGTIEQYVQETGRAG